MIRRLTFDPLVFAFVLAACDGWRPIEAVGGACVCACLPHDHNDNDDDDWTGGLATLTRAGE